MPTRILRDWTDSQRLEKVSAEAERLFVRLIMKADDFGRFHADPRLVSAACLPLVRQMTDKAISSCLKELADADLIDIYSSSGRNYLEIKNFNQRTRSQSSKFPANDGQMTVKCLSNDGQVTARDGDEVGDVVEDGDGDGVKTPASSFDELAEDLRDIPGLVEAWGEWKQYRKEKRLRLTKTTCKLQMNTLRQHRQDAVAIIRKSMMMEWRGLFELKPGERQSFKKQQVTNGDLI